MHVAREITYLLYHTVDYLLGELECFLLFFVSGDLDRRSLEGDGDCELWCLLWEGGEGERFRRLGEEEGERCLVLSGERLGLRFLLLDFDKFSRSYFAA